MKLTNIKLQCCDIKLCDTEPLQVNARSYFYSVSIRIKTSVSLNLCDPKRSRPVNTLALLVLYN